MKERRAGTIIFAVRPKDDFNRTQLAKSLTTVFIIAPIFEWVALLHTEALSYHDVIEIQPEWYLLKPCKMDLK